MVLFGSCIEDGVAEREDDCTASSAAKRARSSSFSRFSAAFCSEYVFARFCRSHRAEKGNVSFVRRISLSRSGGLLTGLDPPFPLSSVAYLKETGPFTITLFIRTYFRF